MGAGTGMGAHSFLACSRARAWPKWNKSKMPAHSRRFAQRGTDQWCRPTKGRGPRCVQRAKAAPSAYILTGLPSRVPAVLEGPSSDRAVHPAMVSSASARTSRASAGIVGARSALSSDTAGVGQRLLRAFTIASRQTLAVLTLGKGMTARRGLTKRDFEGELT